MIFAIGAEVMLHSLRQHFRSRRPQVVMVTSEVSQMKRQALKSVVDDIVEVRCKLQAVAGISYCPCHSRSKCGLTSQPNL